MPTLNWIGKDAVVRHHQEVPFRLLEPVSELSCRAERAESSEARPSTGSGRTAAHDTVRAEPAQAQSGNLIVQGDNLHALKALLPRYAGQVKCIYIDPPYNTGNEGWAYNDNVNSPEIRRWLGEVVGREGETLDRHDRWLCMMYPRLVLLRQFLREDGVIFVSIDDFELHHLRILMDEIFGAGCYKNTIAVRRGIKNVQAQFDDVSALSLGHEYVLVYSRISTSRFPKLTLSHEEIQPGKWDTFWRGTDRPTMRYELFGFKPESGQWRWEESRTKLAIKNYEDYIRNHSEEMTLDEWYVDNLTTNNIKLNFVRKNEEGSIQYYVPPSGGKLLSDNWMDIFLSGSETDFDTEKSAALIQRIIGWTTSGDDLVMDSFAGSGTTGHAVLKQNAEDGGNRRFILVEMDEGIAQKVTAERVRRAATGYTNARGQVVDGLGGGFQFCRLSAEPLFDADGQIRRDVSFAQLAEFVWFAETGSAFFVGAGHARDRDTTTQAPGSRPWDAPTPLLGIHDGRAIYLLYNGILKDKSVAGGNVLTGPVFDLLPPFAGPKVIYAAANRMGARAAREGVTFKQTPYALAV